MMNISRLIRVLVRRDLDGMSELPGLDHGCKPLTRPELKKILRFTGYYSIVTIAGERWFRCISPDHEGNPGIWLKLLEFDAGVEHLRYWGSLVEGYDLFERHPFPGLFGDRIPFAHRIQVVFDSCHGIDFFATSSRRLHEEDVVRVGKNE